MNEQNYKSSRFERDNEYIEQDTVELPTENEEDTEEGSGSGIFKVLRILCIILAAISALYAFISGDYIIWFSVFGVLIINSIFVYAIERIIDLLYQIKCNTDKE